MRKLFIVAMIGMVSAINVFADDPPVSVPSSSPSPSIIKKEAQKQKSDAERQKAKEEREKAEKNKGDGNSNANNNGNTTNNGGNTNDDD